MIAARSSSPQSSRPCEDSQASFHSNRHAPHSTSSQKGHLIEKLNSCISLKKERSWLAQKTGTFFSSFSCCGRFIEWNTTAFTFTPASMNTFIVLTALLNSSHTPIRVTARPSSLAGFNMIKHFKHYHKLLVLDKNQHFQQRNRKYREK